MLIRLEYNGRVVHEIDANTIAGELVIGRSRTCTWPAPPEDTVISSRHASIFRKGRAVWLKDLESTNGTFFRGKKIAQKRLSVGLRIGVGNCVLVVDEPKGTDGKTPSEVLVLTGKARGQRKPLVPPVFTIGADPESSLVFLDSLISRKHAEITVKDDGCCWLRDLGSKNGTSVNGLPLRDDKERLLKDGDRISISHLELEFHDGNVKRTHKQIWLRMGILAATLLVALGLYRSYQLTRSPAEAFIQEARRLAAGEQFTAAGEELEKAMNARHVVQHQVEVDDLRRLLVLWKNTDRTWQETTNLMQQGAWEQVSRNLGVLQAGRQEAWEWNDQARAEKRDAWRAKTALDTFLRAKTLMGNEDSSVTDLSLSYTNVCLAVDDVQSETNPYLCRLKEELVNMKSRESSLLQVYDRFEEGLSKLPTVGEQEDYDKILQVVMQLRSTNEAALKQKALAVEKPIAELAKSFACLQKATRLARDMEFSEVKNMDLGLPAEDQCSIDSRVLAARMNIASRFANLQSIVRQVENLMAGLDRVIKGAGAHAANLEVFLDPGVMDKVIACDSLEHALPKRSRKEPVGKYDELLGIEEFSAYLSALPAPMDSSVTSDLPFESALGHARTMIQKIEAILIFLKQNEWLIHGKIAEEQKRLEKVLKKREEVVKILTDRAETSTGRTALITGGIVVRLCDESELPMISNKRAREWLLEEVKKVRSSLIRLNDEYATATPERQIKIRNEILKNGLPGDSIVRRMWTIRDSVAADAKGN